VTSTRVFCAGACVVALSLSSTAHIRLTTSAGNELRWGQPANISIVVNQQGSDDVTDGSHMTAIQNAISAWNSASGSAARLVENSSPAQRARTDWPNDNIHLVLFDETGSSGYFPSGTGIVAITPVWFTASGVISDADVLFNGRDFSFTTDGDYGAYDIQDVAAHEIGHLLGLDHSGWAGATMYPYVDPTILLHRSLSQDDVCGMRAAYPGAAFGTLSGFVRYPNDDFVEGAHVIALDGLGRPYGATLSSNLGYFAIRGLPVGNYSLYATPLDAPVSAHNLSSAHDIHTNFRTTSLGTFNLPTTTERNVGNLNVQADTSLGLGRTSDDLPVRCLIGRTRTAVLHGAGLAPGSTLESSDSSVTIVPISWSWTQVSFQITVPQDETIGHVDVTVVNAAGERSTLVAALEITPTDPSLTNMNPARGSIHGGDLVTLTGLNFRRGARVVLGSRVYVEGVAGGCTVVDDTTLHFVTGPSDYGATDLVVIDATGVEGRVSNGFTFESEPGITSVFPSSGSSSGGTQVTIRGADFVDGCVVTIDGVVQTSSDFVSSTKLVVNTAPGVPGGPYTVEVQNPLGEFASALYMYWSDPDPLVTSIDPATGMDAGGSVVMIHGANFTATCDVVFGADADTGMGGSVASGFEFIDANTLRVISPASSSGSKSVIVKDAFSNQATVAPVAFVYQSSKKGGGGGCASLGPRTSGWDGFRDVGNFGAILLAFGWIVLRGLRDRSKLARTDVARERVTR